MSSVRRATSSPVNERGAGSGCVSHHTLRPPGSNILQHICARAPAGGPTGPLGRPAHPPGPGRMIMNRRTLLRLGAGSALAALATDVPALAQQKLVLKATDVHPL